MKRACVIFILLVTFMLYGNMEISAEVNSNEMRGVWVTSVLNLDWPSRPGLSAAEMMREADVILDRAQEIGLNTVFFQVRPNADALYNSSIFPWSEYLTGTQGQAPPDGFDPLRYWIDGAHARGMELHAWLNPYRVTHAAHNITDISVLHPDNPARLRPYLAQAYLANRWAFYFDPGIPAARELIVAGIVDLISNYNVDGIHLDDYFYPGRDFDDNATFAAYGAGWDSKDDWRRENVNILVRDIQAAIRAVNPNIRFSISPVGIWRNLGSSPLGSDTRGFEGYSAIFGDSKRWALEGWVDFLIPQIYWFMGHQAADFNTLIHWWNQAIGDSDTDLIIGLATYNEYLMAAGWTEGEIVRQLEYMRAFPNIAGHVHFRANHLFGRIGDEVRDFYAGAGNIRQQDYVFAPVQVVEGNLTVVQPSRDVTVTGFDGYFMFGAGNPNYPIYVNGHLIENRTAEGFWMLYAPMNVGTYTFTFTQHGQPDITRTITNNAPPVTTPRPPAEPPRILGASLAEQLLDRHYTTATIEEPVWAFPGPATTGGSNLLLLPGQSDFVTGITEDNAWVRLHSGMWVQWDNAALPVAVTSQRGGEPRLNVLTDGVYTRDWPDLHSITWQMTEPPVLNINYEDHVLTVYFGLHDAVPMLDIARAVGVQDTIFSVIQAGVSDGTPFYRFVIRPEVLFEGYWVSFSGNEFRLNLSLRKTLREGDRPLDGFVFMLDAGHGGGAPGAVGALGGVMAEKDIVFLITEELAVRLLNLGAQVHLTRRGDYDPTLFRRTEMSRALKPDMFLSIHADSTGEGTDATNIRGSTVLYRNALSYPLARTLRNHLHDVNPYTTRAGGIRSQNLFVTRPAWTPSVLIETSFMNNINDFSWLLNEGNRAKIADRIVAAILEYYGGS